MRTVNESIKEVHASQVCHINQRDRLRGTSTGANNRIDLLTLVTSGMNNDEVDDPEDDILGIVERWWDDETRNPDVPAISHKRGLTTFIFVHFDQITAPRPVDSDRCPQEASTFSLYSPSVRRDRTSSREPRPIVNIYEGSSLR